MKLTKLGWDGFFESQLAGFGNDNLQVGRVSLQQKKRYRIIAESGEYDAVIPGRLRHNAESLADFPVVGDWVLFKFKSDRSMAVIHHILERKTKISRDTSARKDKRIIADEQVIVANVDTVFLVAALNEELNPKRIERYLTLIWDSGAEPVLLLNKADLCPDIDRAMTQVRDAAAGVPVHTLSAIQQQGLDELRPYLREGKTIALLGSSGVGKSTIINKLLGQDLVKVAETSSSKARGRHTTTFRSLYILPDGAILIDNPGLRSIQLWDGGEGLKRSFQDIETLAVNCRFNDCRHTHEPGCAVLQALSEGEISAERYDSYIKLQKELEHRARKENWAMKQNTKKRWKTISKTARQIRKYREGGEE